MAPLRCDPELLKKDLEGYVIIVTGANSGCGLEAARQLTKQNAKVIMACRNETKAQKAVSDVGGKAEYLPLDLSSLKSVRAFVEMFRERHDRLDALVNNAGVMACPYSATEDGFETQIGCNHLGHFLLMTSLAPTLVDTAKKTGRPSRFVALSSVAASAMAGFGDGSYAEIDLDDLSWKTREYDAIRAYQQSKLANHLHAREAADRYDASKLLSFSVHPGWVRSNLDQHVLGDGGSSFFGNIMRSLFQLTGHMISADDGAQTTLHCLLQDAAEMRSGDFYSQFGIYKDKECRNGGWPMKLVNENATPEVAKRLWEESEKLVSA